MENRFTNTLSGFWDDVQNTANNVLNQGVSRVDETNKNLATTNQTVAKLYSDYQIIKPIAIVFGLILTGYLATGLMVNYNEIKGHARRK
jgi:hypothetical protein